MGAKTGKTDKSRKNMLMLVRTGVLSALALVMAIVVSFAWFFTGGPRSDYIQVEVSGGIKGSVRLFWGVVPAQYIERMLRQEIDDAAVVDIYNYTNSEITDSSVPTYVPYTDIYMAPGNGDCYKIEVRLQNKDSAVMSVELVSIKWNIRVTAEQREAMSGHIWINSFLQGTFSNPCNVFIWNAATGNYQQDITFAPDLEIGASANFYYYFYLDPDFPNVIDDYLLDEPLFTISHIRVTLK